MRKSIFAIILTVCMIISIMPSVVEAAEESYDTVVHEDNIQQVTDTREAAATSEASVCDYSQVEGDRVGYKNQDHTYDDIIAQALWSKTTSLIESKYGLTSDNWQLLLNYVLASRKYLSGAVGVSNTYSEYLLATGQVRDYCVEYAEGYDDRIAPVRY